MTTITESVISANVIVTNKTKSNFRFCIFFNLENLTEC